MTPAMTPTMTPAMTRILLSLAILASFTLSALADIPPPPPKRGEKRVPFENVLKLEKEIPDYKFYAFQRLGLSGKETLGEELKLNTKTGVPVPSTSSPSVRTGIIAVPTKVMEELKTKEKLAELLSRDFKGELPKGVVVHETYGSVSDLKTSDPRTKVENVITAAPDEKAGVKFSEKETPAPQTKSASPKTSSAPNLALIIAGLAISLSILTLGFWIVRRNRKSSSTVSKNTSALAASPTK